MKYNIFWYLMYKLFKIRKPCPKELLDFDETIAMSDYAKEKLCKK